MDLRPFTMYLQDGGLHATTIYNYNRLVRYHLTFFSSDFTQQQAIKLIDQANTTSAKLSLAKTVSKWLQYKKKDNDQIVDKIRILNELYQRQSELKRKAMGKNKDLPTYNNLIQLLQDHYEENRWKEYCILFLLLNYNVRNLDMVGEVVRDGRNRSNHFNWFVIRKDSILWKRNLYKTVQTYGAKQHVIKNRQFMHAIQHLGSVLSVTDNLDRVVKKATSGLGEASVLKIYLSTPRTASEFKRVSRSRGTDLNTLLTSYNISK
jgi:hypothetical protein